MYHDLKVINILMEKLKFRLLSPRTLVKKSCEWSGAGCMITDREYSIPESILNYMELLIFPQMQKQILF